MHFAQRKFITLTCLKRAKLQMLARHEILLKILHILRITLHDNSSIVYRSLLTIIRVDFSQIS
jgi:hypothetical protein